MSSSRPEPLPLGEDPVLPSRYVVGIDLGTTNSAFCYVDTQEPSRQIRTFPIPQLVAAGQVEGRETLPSFLYLAGESEFAAAALQLPWKSSDPQRVVGVLAREQGKLVPGRAIESAKSWLCHAGVDRTAALLPWQGGDEVPRLSPVEVSAAYLTHLRAAWDSAHPADPLAAQDVVITLPASFDEVARELTIQAARLAGLRKILLIEEPQAAFYCWINSHREDWEQRISAGQNILVCDVGGGTTDFTLIRVRRQTEGTVQFHRIAVGEHLILGGDNMDLALARHLEPRFKSGANLDVRQWGSLVRLCRQAKENLLGGRFDAAEEESTSPERLTITIPGVGSRLIGGGLRAEVTRDEARNWLVDGFLPWCEFSDAPQQRRSGFQEFGLPYAPDAAISRYLAAFLREHQHHRLPGEDDSASQRPDVLLFNGGVFVSPLMRDRVIELLAHWYRTPEEPNWRPTVLANERHDLAVARGAAYYGMVRRGEGVRIAAGLPRTYYIGIQGTDPAHVSAVCLVPAGMEPGQEVHLASQTFELAVATPVEFPLYHSSVRLLDQPGDVVVGEREQFTALPPIRTVLRSRKVRSTAHIPVQLNARLTELGTLELWCTEVNGTRTWQIQFDIRSATQTDRDAHTGQGESLGVVDQELVETGARLIQQVFGSDQPGPTVSVRDLPVRLSEALELPREEWPPALLRALWEVLLEVEPGRQRSAEHEARWLNLLGYTLRPGFGVALDDWRIAETWKLLRGKLFHPTASCLAEWRILWRRIAGGLSAGQQQSLVGPLLGTWRDHVRRAAAVRPDNRPARKLGLTQADAEVWRMLGACELLPISLKTELGEMALALLEQPEFAPLHEALLWALGRLGSRQPLAGPLNTVLPAATVANWLPKLLQGTGTTRQLAVMQWTRRTDDRYRDVSAATRDKALHWLAGQPHTDHLQHLVREGGHLAGEEQSQVFGEALPTGLRLAQK